MASHASRLAAAGLTFALLLATAPLQAQTGAVEGRITAEDTEQPIPGAEIQVIAADGQIAATVMSDAAGRFRAEVAPGSYAVAVSMVGYETRRVEDVRVATGETTTASATLSTAAFELNPVVVTASRRQEKVLDAPAAVTIVDSREVEARPAATVVEHVRAVPGVDVASSGLVQTNVVTRGFNNVFSGSLLMLTDNRYAHVPSLRVNASYLIPLTNEDIERIEVVLGPGAALYGPNSANGVMHVITSSPFDRQETTLSMAGGARASADAQPADGLGLAAPDAAHGLLHLSGRHADAINDHWAYKVSGQYFRGADWPFYDPAEVAARSAAIDAGVAQGVDRETLLDTLRIGSRDFTAERWSGEARVDWRPDAETEAILAAGATTAMRTIELTGVAAAQARDWRYTYYQARFRRDRLFAQAFLNTSDAGDTFLLRTGEPIVDRSNMFVGQLQHGFDLGDRQTFIYGADFLYTNPRTGGTINGRNEADDRTTEVGGYVHSETSLSPRFELVTAIRLDHHSRLPDPIVSPRAALVFRPAESQNFRLTYNRAFSTPSNNNLFLDITAARLSPLPFEVRAFGVPEGGFGFARDCGSALGGLCMRSPFTAAGATTPAGAAASQDQLWRAVMNLEAVYGPVLQQTGIDLRDIPAPAPDEVGTVLRRLDSTDQTFRTVAPGDVIDVAQLEPPITNTLEVGYKGLVDDRLMLAADAWYERRTDFIGPLIAETPNVFFERGSLVGYLTQQGVPAGVANTVATSLAGVDHSAEITGLPLGTVLPDHERVDDGDILLTYRNFGEVDLWGADIAAQLLIGERYSLGGSYSFVSNDYFPQEEVGGSSDVALNAPQHKGSITAQRRDEEGGLDAELRVRYTDGFPVNSGVYIGEVEPYTVVDASVGYPLPLPGSPTATLQVRNLFDNLHREFVGAPELGRLVLGRIQYTF